MLYFDLGLSIFISRMSLAKAKILRSEKKIKTNIAKKTEIISQKKNNQCTKFYRRKRKKNANAKVNHCSIQTFGSSMSYLNIAVFLFRLVKGQLCCKSKVFNCANYLCQLSFSYIPHSDHSEE